MTVNPFIVEEWMGRRLANSDKAKRFTKGALERKLAKLEPPFEYVLKPFFHQMVSILLALKYGSYFYILDAGLGKTKIILDLFNYRRKLGVSSRLLVLVPNTANIGGWEEEVAIHAPNLWFAGLDDTVSRAEREAMVLDETYDVVCVTYMGWLSLVTQKVKFKRKRRGKKSGWEFAHKRALELERQFDELAVDESSMIQGHTALPFRAVRRLRKTCPFVHLANATPFNKDPSALWSQFYAVDGGETLGKTIGLFREGFFNEKTNYWSGREEYVFDKARTKLLHRWMKNRSVRFAEEEVEDMPKVVGGIRAPMVRKVKLPPGTWTYYEKLVEEFDGVRGNLQAMKATYIRMRQLVSGFLPLVDPETKERHVVVFEKNPLLDGLVGLLREIGTHKKVIVAVVYKKTGAIVLERLRKEGFKAERLFSGTPKKNQVMKDFKTGATQVLVGSESICRGHNLQHASHHLVMYETPTDVDDRKQLEKRIARTGQERTCYIWDLVVVGTPAEKILKGLQEDTNFFDELVDGKEQL